MEYLYGAPWAGNYQSNINLQEIYWSCGPTDLDECQQAYIDWIDNLSIPGREIAKRSLWYRWLGQSYNRKYLGTCSTYW